MIRGDKMPESLHNRQQFSVLIAEDSNLMRNVLKDMLLAMGFIVEEAENGRQALELYRTQRFHIVITDWLMPEMNGLELCKEIRSDSGGSGYTYIIMLTAQDSKNDIIAGLDAGADEYLVKPVHKPELEARIRTALRIIELEGIREAHVEQARAVSLVDALTGVHNRKFMEERLPLEIKRANRYQRPLSIILCGYHGLDQFRKSKGMFPTEKLLQATATALDGAIRKDIDWVARWDEHRFLILLPETETADAGIVAKRFRIRMGQVLIELKNEHLQVQTLYGVSGFVGSRDKKEMTPDILLEHAQRTLDASSPAIPISCVRLG